LSEDKRDIRARDITAILWGISGSSVRDALKLLKLSLDHDEGKAIIAQVDDGALTINAALKKLTSPTQPEKTSLINERKQTLMDNWKILDPDEDKNAITKMKSEFEKLKKSCSGLPYFLQNLSEFEKALKRLVDYPQHIHLPEMEAIATSEFEPNADKAACFLDLLLNNQPGKPIPYFELGKMAATAIVQDFAQVREEGRLPELEDWSCHFRKIRQIKNKTKMREKMKNTILKLSAFELLSRCLPFGQLTDDFLDGCLEIATLDDKALDLLHSGIIKGANQ